MVHDWTKAAAGPEEGFSDRSIERPFVFSNLPSDGKVLDIGCAGSDLPVVLACFGFDVVGIDSRPYHMTEAPFRFVQSDIRRMAFADGAFDIVTAVSTVEHIGLSGRYGSDEDPSGDRRAMKEIGRVTRSGGTILLTVPYGQPAVFRPWHRVYGAEQLQGLVEGLNIVKASFFMPDGRGLYQKVDQATASSFAASAEVKRGRFLEYSYGLACLALRKPNS
jgi:SAM-dependent methyltransferase